MEDQSYIDSRGAEMAAMSWTEALGIVHDLASQNQLEDSHVAGDPSLREVRKWQQGALDTLEGLLGSAEVDALDASAQAGEWPDAAWRAERSMNPDDPANAIRICLDLAQDAAIDTDGVDGIEMADEADRQQQAFDMARDLLGMHAAAISAIGRSPRP